MSKGVLAPLEQLVEEWRQAAKNNEFLVSGGTINPFAYRWFAKELETLLAALPGLGGPQEHKTSDDFIEQATKLSGCAWECYQKNRYRTGFGACCSSCQNIAFALADAANLALSVPAPQEPAQ